MAAVMMVLAGGRGGSASDTATGLEMSAENGIGAQGMRDGFGSGKNAARGMAMVVGQNYEVSMQATLTARWVRK